MEDFKGARVQEAPPSYPVVIIGFPQVPKVGETLKVFPGIEQAQDNIKSPEIKERIANPIAKEGQKVLNLILKFDVEGSIEAMEEVLKEIPRDKIILNILKSEVGEVNESDLKLAIGKIKILGVFLAEKNHQIVGGRVFSGEVKRGALIEVQRNEEVIGKGRMINLQKNKKDADRVTRGEECGILYEGDVKIEMGDVLAIYTETKVRGEL